MSNLEKIVSAMAKTSDSKKKYLLPKDLASVLRCSERTVREYCKQGKIPEAVRTRGGHWRIRRPFSEKTKWLFAKIRGEWPFDGSKEVEKDIGDDVAQWLTEAVLYGKTVEECCPAPDFVDLPPEKRAMAFRIQTLVWEKLKVWLKFKNKKPLSDLILSGTVYQFWLRYQRCPTVPELVKLMSISRSEFYRRGHSLAEIRAACEECDPIRTELPSNVPADFGDDTDIVDS